MARAYQMTAAVLLLFFSFKSSTFFQVHTCLHAYRYVHVTTPLFQNRELISPVCFHVCLGFHATGPPLHTPSVLVSFSQMVPLNLTKQSMVNKNKEQQPVNRC